MTQLNTTNVSTTASSIERELNKIRENISYPVSLRPQLQEYLETLISEFLRFPISQQESVRYDRLFGTLSAINALLAYKQKHPQMSRKIDQIIREGLTTGY